MFCIKIKNPKFCNFIKISENLKTQTFCKFLRNRKFSTLIPAWLWFCCWYRDLKIIRLRIWTLSGRLFWQNCLRAAISGYNREIGNYFEKFGKNFYRKSWEERACNGRNAFSGRVGKYLKFLTEDSTFEKIFDFSGKCPKMSPKIWPKIEILTKSKIWPKIKNFK